MNDKDDSADLPDDATRPMPAVSDADATQVFPAVPRSHSDMPPAVAPPGASAPLPDYVPSQRSAATRVAIGLAIALLVLLVFSVIAALLTSRGPFSPGPSSEPTATSSPSPTASASPSPSASVTPSPSPTPTPSPEPTETTPAGPTFTSFVAPGTAACADETSTAEVTLTWTSNGAERAWVGIATDNAKEEPYSDAPTSGTATLPFPCSNASQVYTVTLEDGSGNLAHQSATVERALP